MAYYDYYPEYVPVAKRKEKAKKQIEKLKKKKSLVAQWCY